MTTFNNATTQAFNLNASNNASAQPKHPLKVASPVARKTTEDTFVKAKEPNGVVASAAVTTKQSNQWLLPILGSAAGLILAGITFVVGKKQAETETLKIISEKTGKAGETAEKLAEALKKEMNQSPSSVQQFSDKAIALLQSLLPSEHQNKTGDDLITAVQAHVKKLEREAIAWKKEIDDAEVLLKKLLIDNNLAADANLKDKNYAELLKLVQTAMINLQQQKAPPGFIEAEVTRLYGAIVGGTETDVAKQLAAIAKHNTDTTPKLQEQLKKALLAGGVHQAEIDACGDDFGALSKLVETKIQNSKVAPLNSEVLDRVEALINDAYAKTGEEGANTLEEKVSALLELVESQQELIRMYNGMIENFHHTLSAEKTKAVGSELAKIFESSEPTPLTSILTQKVEKGIQYGSHQIKNLDELKEVLTNGFEDDGSIMGCNSTNPAKGLGFFLQNAQALPTKLTLVARMLVDCLGQPELNSQLKPEERQLVTNYLDNLLSHPQAKASQHYLKTALELPDDFALRTKLLNSIFSDNTNHAEVQAHLLEHLKQPKITNSSEAGQALEDIIPQLVADVNQSPKDFKFLEGGNRFEPSLSPSDRILQRALELACQKSLLEALSNTANLIPSEDPTGTQREASQQLMNTFKAGLESNNLFTLLRDAIPVNPNGTYNNIYNQIENILNVSRHEQSVKEIRFMKSFSNSLVRDFAEVYFPKIFGNNQIPQHAERLTKLGELAEKLDEGDPRKKAIATVQAFHEHINAIEQLPA